MVGIQIRKNGIKAKDQVLDYIKNNEKWYKIQYKKTGKPKIFVYDEIDSLVMAKYGLIIS